VGSAGGKSHIFTMRLSWHCEASASAKVLMRQMALTFIIYLAVN
jgi:hypothetical protein